LKVFTGIFVFHLFQPLRSSICKSFDVWRFVVFISGNCSQGAAQPAPEDARCTGVSLRSRIWYEPEVWSSNSPRMHHSPQPYEYGRSMSIP
jgi:hypothetical protein